MEPKLLFKWLANDRPRYFFEFLDNSVPLGTYPELIARGTQGSMQIFKPDLFIDIERYRRINVLAASPQQVAPDPALLKVENNLGFLRQCIERIEHLEFIDPETGSVYLEIQAGKFQLGDEKLFTQRLAEQTLREIVAQLAPELLRESSLH